MHDWLQDERRGPWLIILDNVDDASFLTLPSPGAEAEATKTESANSRQLVSYLPYCQHGSVLITSRSRGAALELVDYADIIAIEPMSESDALQLFQNKLGQRNADACTTELAASLEYMPLAIAQAAAYILRRHPRCSVRKYLDEFRESDKRKAGLLGEEGGKLRRDAEAKNSILITWQISFDYIRLTRPSAADLLSLMSFCDRQGIPENLLHGQCDRKSSYNEQEPHDSMNDTRDGNNHNNAADDDQKNICSDSDSTELQSVRNESDRFEDDIITLRNFSFIVANDNGITFEMHRLVQLATLEWLKAHGIQEQWKHRFLVRLCAELPTGEYENWAKCQALFPHAQSVASQQPEAEESTREWATILYKAAWYALAMGRGAEAEKLSIRAMKARKKIFDGEHEDIVWSLAMVASAYSLRGRWEAAEELQVQVMETRKKKLGEDHPDTLTSMANLASTYMNQGRWEAAEELNVQVMETRKKKLGEDHPDTLTIMANLASTYRSQGRWEAAEELNVQVMETRKKKLGEDHPDTLTSVNNLAWTYWSEGRPEEAKSLMRQCVKLRRAKLGASHPDYSSAAGTLARWESG